MIKCKKCSSTDVKVKDLNCASRKREGESTVKHTYNKKEFHCRNCDDVWMSIPEAEKDYYEYVDLCNQTTVAVRDVKKDSSYGPPTRIVPEELLRRIELAKIIVGSYEHVLDLDPGEWCDLEEDTL